MGTFVMKDALGTQLTHLTDFSFIHQIEKGYNKVASGFVDDCLSGMRGLDVDSPLFRSKIQLKQCTILSGMGKYEEALENCDAAVELRYVNGDVANAFCVHSIFQLKIALRV